MRTQKALKTDFDVMFRNKKEAVVCYLSLERRYMELGKRYDEALNRIKELESLTGALTMDRDINGREDDSQKCVINYLQN